MNRETGAAISTLDHISQCITDILTTRIGTRVMRREYGSLLPELVDHPFNDATRLRVYAGTVMALMRWETRISLSACSSSERTCKVSRCWSWKAPSSTPMKR